MGYECLSDGSKNFLLADDLLVGGRSSHKGAYARELVSAMRRAHATMPAIPLSTAGVSALSSVLDGVFGVPTITKVVFNDPATIVWWKDGTKTVVKVQEGDTFNKEQGIALAFMKKTHGNNGRYNDVIKRFAGEDVS